MEDNLSRLVAKARHGDLEAFGKLVEHYQNRIFALCYGIVGNREDADDIAQETFIMAYQSLGTLRAEAAFYSWLAKIAVNSSLNYKKKAQTARTVPFDAAGEPVYQGETPESHAESQADREWLEFGGNIVNFADTAVPAGTTVENVIVVGGNATIAGTVTDEVVVLNGNATLTSTAYVRDRVIVLGGKLNAEDGAYVGKGVFRIGGDFALAATLISAGFLVMLLWFVGIAATAGLVVIPAAVAWGLGTKVEAMAEVIREHAGRTVLVGLLGGLAVAIAALILAFTIVGIPLAVLLVLAAGLASLYGLSGVCCQLGRSMPLSIAPGRREVIYRTLCGAVLLALVFNVPLVGLIAIKLGLITGFGAVILSIFAKWAKSPHDAGRQ